MPNHTNKHLNKDKGRNKKRRRLTFDKRLKMWNDCKGICYLCGEFIPFIKMNIDHVVPISKGGSVKDHNLKPTHIKCNENKGNKL